MLITLPLTIVKSKDYTLDQSYDTA